MATSQTLRLRFADPNAKLPGEFMRLYGRYPVQLESFEGGEWVIVPMVMEGMVEPQPKHTMPKLEVAHD
jgi:hypothetical protein